MEKKKSRDKHKSGFLVRLPEDLRPLLDAIRAKLGQPYTVSTQRALKDYALKHQVEPPPGS